MMEDTGEDVLRQRPNMLVTFFQRLGQVIIIYLVYNKLTLKPILFITNSHLNP